MNYLPVTTSYLIMDIEVKTGRKIMNAKVVGGRWRIYDVVIGWTDCGEFLKFWGKR